MNEPTADHAREAVDAIYRSESRRVLATLIRLLGGFDLAEEALHEAFAAAVEQWPREAETAGTMPGEAQDIEDDRLRLIFTCCHPALPLDAQVALTLREVCGLTTEEIARAFLTAPPTLAQ